MPLGSLGEAPAGYERLGNGAAIDAVVEKRRELGEKLFPEGHTKEKLTAVLRSAREVHSDYVDLRRLENRNLRGQFEAYAGADEIVLRERTELPTPEQLAHIDHEANRIAVARLLGRNSGTIDASLLVERMPTDVFRALEQAGLKPVDVRPTAFFMRIPAKALSVFTAAVPITLGLVAAGSGVATPLLVGAAAAFALPARYNPAVHWVARRLDRQPTTPLTNGHGFMNAFTGRVSIAKLSWDRGDTVASTLAHELMHALDHALGWLSEEPLFRRVFASLDRFPTDYAAVNQAECFAEAAIAYLNMKQMNAGRAAEVCTRGDLLAMCPDLYDYMENLFEVRLPRALERGEIVPASGWAWQVLEPAFEHLVSGRKS